MGGEPRPDDINYKQHCLTENFIKLNNPAKYIFSSKQLLIAKKCIDILQILVLFSREVSYIPEIRIRSIRSTELSGIEDITLMQSPAMILFLYSIMTVLNFSSVVLLNIIFSFSNLPN